MRKCKSTFTCGWQICGRGKDYACKYKEQLKPKPDKSLNDLVFGDEIEVKTDEGWKPAKFICYDGDCACAWIFLDGPPTSLTRQNNFTWRLPLKSRMRKGQPVFINNIKVLRIFSHFDADGDVCVFSGSDKFTETVAWQYWRLPTKDELEAIGHSDGGWLYEDEK